jgi:hypothetical protein
VFATILEPLTLRGGEKAIETPAAADWRFLLNARSPGGFL